MTIHVVYSLDDWRNKGEEWSRALSALQTMAKGWPRVILKKGGDWALPKERWEKRFIAVIPEGGTPSWLQDGAAPIETIRLHPSRVEEGLARLAILRNSSENTAQLLLSRPV